MYVSFRMNKLTWKLCVMDVLTDEKMSRFRSKEILSYLPRCGYDLTRTQANNCLKLK